MLHQFFDPSLLPVTTTDLEGNILYVRTHGLFHYGYPDIIVENGDEESEQLLLDILDRIFNMDFNINTTWNYNGRIFRLEKNEDGLAHVVYPETDETRIITILNPESGNPSKFFTKGLSELFNHPEAEVTGDIPFAKDILSYIIDQIKMGTTYDEDTIISFEDYVYGIRFTKDRVGNPLIEVGLQQAPTEKTAKTHKRASSHLVRIK